MAFIREELKTSAKNQLSGNWGTTIGALLIMWIVIGLSTGIFTVIFNYGEEYYNGLAMALGTLGSFVIGILLIPLSFGLWIFFLNLAKGRPVTVTLPFEGYHRFGPSIILYILYSVFTFLWSLLLFIPGIIKGISYSMSYYILAEDENIAPIDAITKSRKMMNGYKAEYFVLYLSFIPWILLCFVTCGLALFYVVPYMQATATNFYLRLKAEYEGNEYTDVEMANRAERAAEEVMDSAVAAPAAEVAEEAVPEVTAEEVAADEVVKEEKNE